MKRIYILTETYPSERFRYQMAFIHPRVKGYINAGFDVKVISFRAKNDYVYEGVSVLTKKSGEIRLGQENEIILMSHSPNLRHHIPFIRKWDDKISNLILFFHGHESLPLRNYYPKPFKFDRKGQFNYLFHLLYDPVKLWGLKKFITQRLIKGNTELIYVSEWFKNEASKCIGMDFLNNEHVHVINNGLNQYIKEADYNLNEKYADFIALRPIDQAKCAIETIVYFAQKHPECSFHIYGKGNYFKYHPQPDNLKLISEFISPKDMPSLFNHYSYAIIPTHQDTQGVMMCEMASHGIPTLVSDLPVCHEMLDKYPNVMFISNDDFDCRVEDIPKPLTIPIDRFSYESTIGKEIELLFNALN